MAVLLFGAVLLILRFVYVLSWWAFLWAPLFVLGVAVAAYEWWLLRRRHYRMSVLEWFLLVVAHLGCVASAAAILGSVHY
ncbi:hypothetical protein [Streptomyces sp. NPDC055709]